MSPFPPPRRRLLVWVAAAALAAGGGSAAALVATGGRGVEVSTRPPAGTSTTTTSTTSAPAVTTSTTATAVPSGPTVACAALVSEGPSISATAVLGPVTARLAGTAADANGLPSVASPVLTVTDGSRTVVSEPVAPPKDMMAGHLAVIPTGLVASTPPSGPSAGASVSSAPEPLCLARFAGSSDPTVVLGLNLGGAHCCTVVRAYLLPSGAPVELDLGNPSASLVGRPTGALIVTGDNSFDYQFGSYADSGVPLKILELRKGSFADTTRGHPDLLADDAARWKTYVLSPTTQDRLGVLAAWVADECLLGQATQALQTVDLLNQQGSLTGTAGWPTGSAYVSALRVFLTKHGYL